MQPGRRARDWVKKSDLYIKQFPLPEGIEKRPQLNRLRLVLMKRTGSVVSLIRPGIPGLSTAWMMKWPVLPAVRGTSGSERTALELVAVLCYMSRFVEL